MPVSFVVATVSPVGPVTTSRVVKGSRRPLVSYAGASACGTGGAAGTSAGAWAVRVTEPTVCAGAACAGAVCVGAACAGAVGTAAIGAGAADAAAAGATGFAITGAAGAGAAAGM